MSSQSIQDERERWTSLLRYDAEISLAAERLQPYGQKWIDEFAKAFFALKEDRKYLSSIVNRLTLEAQEEIKRDWISQTKYTHNREITSIRSFEILEKAVAIGFSLRANEDRTLVAHKIGIGTTYLYSNADIERFARIQKL